MHDDETTPEDRLLVGETPRAGGSGGEFLLPEIALEAPVAQPGFDDAGGSAADRPRRSRRRRRPKSDAAGQPRPALLRRTDPLLRWCVIALLVFAPLAWGSVEAWSGMVVVIGSVLPAALWLAREAACPEACAAERMAESHAATWSSGVASGLAAILLLGVVQILPLGSFVAVVSPTAAEIQRLAGVPAAQMALSLAREATLLSLAHLTAMALLFFTVLNTLRSRKEVRRLVLAMVVLGFGFALFGIIRYFTSWGSSYWRGSPGTRSFGPYVNRNHFAALMGMIIPLGLGYLGSLGCRREAEPPAGGIAAGGGDGEHEVRPRQILVGFMVTVMAGALFLSLSRGGIISVLAAISILGLFLGLHRRTRRRGWIAAAAVLSALAFGIWLGAGPLLARFESLQAVFQDPAGDVRPQVWGDALRMATDFPLLGAGLGAFGAVFPRYQTVFTSLDFEHAHNDWLQLAAEGGMAVCVAVIVLLARFAARFRRLIGIRRDEEAIVLGLGGLAGLLAFLLHALTEFNLHIPANALWFTVIAALTLKAVSSRI